MPNLSLFRDNIFGLQNNADYIKSLQNQPVVEINPMAPELQQQAQPDTAVLEGIMALVQAMQAKEQVGISDVETYPDYIPEEVRTPDVEGFPSDLPPEIQTPDIETFPDYAPGIGDKEGMPDTVPEEVQMGDVEGFPADLPEEVRTPGYQTMDTYDKAKAEVGAKTVKINEIINRDGEAPTKSDVKAIMEKIQRGEEVPPILISPSGVLQDGRHRLEAYRNLGIEDIPVVVGYDPNVASVTRKSDGKKLDLETREYRGQKYKAEVGGKGK